MVHSRLSWIWWVNQLSVISYQLSVINSIIAHHLIIPITVDGGALRRIVSLKLKQKFWPSNAPYVFLSCDLND
ncbi:MAG: hypothetical protein O9324_23475 [Microcystis sp. LE19-84.1B]|uniref:hypothetical protein n=1 Tax=Microcystis sp. LE19-84.1B TaxID=3016438 RepID=UPI0022CC6AE1|nr:hypothetical protein [Microcystis sp. LE19-84.1B]MCZ8226817.1 hypothetical protein [Microcystis sp. LE19-84.1B]